MERAALKAKSHAEAETQTRQQYRSMTPNERLLAARELRKRVFCTRSPDIRECRKNP